MAQQAAAAQPQQQEHKGVSLIKKFADRYFVHPTKLLDTLKKTAFRTDEEITNEQMMALLIVADQYNLNPFTKEIYAFPDGKNGIVPVVGVDGWSRIINSNPMFDGMDFRQSETIIENDEHKPCPEWIECVLYRKDRSHPTVVREYLDEVYRPPFKSRNGNYTRPGPWQTHTKRFLRHKAMIQAARIGFGYVGFYDPDEAERIIEAEAVRVDIGPAKENSESAKPDKSPATRAEQIAGKLCADQHDDEILEHGIGADMAEFVAERAETHAAAMSGCDTNTEAQE